MAALLPASALGAPAGVSITAAPQTSPIQGGGVASFVVTVTNDSGLAPVPATAFSVSVGAVPLVLTGADSGVLGELDPGESWVYGPANNAALSVDTAATPCADPSLTAILSDAPGPDPLPLGATSAPVVTDCAALSIASAGDPPGSYVPGAAHSFTFNVVNSGPGSSGPIATAITTSLAAGQWSCSVPAACSAPGPVSIPPTITLGSAEAVTVTVSGTTLPQTLGDQSAQMTLASPLDTSAGDDTDTDTDTAVATGDVSVVAAGPATRTYTPGALHTIPFTVAHTGGVSTMRVSLATSGVSVLTSLTSQCTTSTGTGVCTAASGPGALQLTLDPGEVATVSISGETQPADLAAAGLTLTATPVGATVDTAAGNDLAVDTDAALPRGDLQVLLSGPASFTYGGSVAYTLTVVNGGPSNLAGVNVRDVIPDAIGVTAWSCGVTLAAPSTSCANLSGSSNDINETVNIGVGGALTYVITGQYEAGTPLGGPAPRIFNTATATPPPLPAGEDADLTNNTKTTPVVPMGEVEVVATITNGRTSYIPGLPVTYTVQILNASPTAVTNMPVSVPLPPGLLSASWTCTTTAGSTCGAPSGLGPIAVNVSLAGGVGARATLSLSAVTSPAATVPLAVAVSADAGPSDVNPANNIDVVDTDAATPSADLVVSLTDGTSTYVPGRPVAYTLRVTNDGPSNAPSVGIGTTLSPLLSAVSWTCTAGCAVAGVGTVGLVTPLAAGEQAVIQITGQTSPSERGQIVSGASAQDSTVGLDPSPVNNQASDIDTAAALADLSVAISDSTSTYTPGASLSYVVQVTNAGPSSVTGARLSTQVDGALEGLQWACSAGCTGQGKGQIDRLLDLAPGAQATLIVSGGVSSASIGEITSVASVGAPAGISDLAPGNNAASDTDGSRPLADLRVTLSAASLVLGGPDSVQTITVTNVGPSDATGVSLLYQLPATLRLVDIQTPRGRCQGIQEISCDLGPLADGQEVQIRVTLAGVSVGTASPSVSATADQPDPVRQSNTAAEAVEVRAGTAVLASGVGATTRTSLSVIVQGPRGPRVGAKSRYVVTVTNTGRTVARNVRLAMTIPLGARLAKAARGSSSTARPVVRWSLARLRPGSSRTFRVDLVAQRSGVSAPPLRVAAENLLRSPRIRRIQLSVRGT